MINVVVIGIPALIIGARIGNILAKKLRQEAFLKLPYILLLISGISLTI